LILIAITLYLMKKDPKLLQRRMSGGPVAEKEPTQKIVTSFASLGFIGLIALPVLDHRWHADRPRFVVGLLIIVAMLPALIWRLIDEERFLARNLSGYVEYQDRVRYLLIWSVG